MIRPGLARVRGASMEPTLHEGDLLLVLWGARPRIGSMAIVELPRDEHGATRPVSVKRVTGRDPDDGTRWWVERDNPRVGVDSWLVGSLPDEAMLARVLMRIGCRRGPFA
ncbi:MAG TPA: S24/S26 family peptidase [Candidatus Janibacter merdipullorum]|nr:S24/S26 family peptidase [Candidatus Janibacter merdipullorum]